MTELLEAGLPGPGLPGLGLAGLPPAPPEIGEGEAAELARALWGVDGVARSLGSHQDRNFVIESAAGPDGGIHRVLLKIAHAATDPEQLADQSRAAARLAEREPALRVPRTRPALDGEAVQRLELGGQTLHARLLDFVEGTPLSGSRYLSPRAVRAIGDLAARVSLALDGLDVADHPHQWDLRRAPEVLADLLPRVTDAALRDDLATTARVAWAAIERVAPELTVQAVHGDLTDDNIVASSPIERLPDGVIDFGDLGRSWRVAELAITLSSLLHHAGGSIESAMRAVTAFHARQPLTEPERAALWPLVVVRGAVLVASAHHVLATDPGNDYAAGNLVHERAIFDRARALPLPVSAALVAAATGVDVARATLPPAAAPLVAALDPASVTLLDLSPTSPLLHEGRWLDPHAEADLTAAALAAGAPAVATAFAQPRLTLARPHSTAAPLNVPLGVELTAGQPLALTAPWPGELVAIDGGLELRAADVTLRIEGQLVDVVAGPVAAGAPLATAPAAAPLRITARAPGHDGLGPDGLGSGGLGPEPPWLTTAALAGAWQALAIDPMPLIAPGAAPARPAVTSAALLDRRRAHFADAQEHYFDEPPVMVRGWREHLIDTDGRVYLDTLNNVTSIGHAHPRLVAAVTEQWQLLNTNSRFHYEAVVELSERLAALAPEGLDAVFLVNSGTEAVDLALRISRAWAGRRDVVAMREAYHGWSDLADAVSTSIADNPDALTTRPDWVHTVEAANSYRGRYRGADAYRYAADAVAVIEGLTAAGTPLGAFIAEPYYGNAGGIPLPDGYLAEVYAAVRAAGGLCVADEVQVGYGRLGRWFWGFEQQGVVPDVIAVAKAMGNGHPLGAVITTREIAERYRSQGYFFSSAGGSPVSSVVGTTVLDVLRDERLQENAADVGAHLKAALAGLGERHTIVGAVHGDGFYLGLELVRDRVTLEPAREETAAICERLRELGVIVQPTSDRQCVLKIKPPMCTTRESADFFVATLDQALRERVE